MKTIPSNPDRMHQYGEARITRTSEWRDSRSYTSHSRIRLIGPRCPECLGKFNWTLLERKSMHTDNRHDVGMQIVGQPARDLCRHFVQRWNYLLRTKVNLECKQDAKGRTTNADCHSYYRLRTSPNASYTISNCKVLVRFRYAGVSGRGRWAP